MADLGRIAGAFEQFAVDCRDSSPLYERLALQIAHDEELLALAAQAAPRQPAPNLLFAAVRFLLYKQDPADAITRPYSELQSLDAFRQFCSMHSSELKELLSTRRVQTNEVGRCAYLFPAFALAAVAGHGRPLAMIEIGTSAGLLLNWDLYAYRYSASAVLGRADSSVLLDCEFHGFSASLPKTVPTVASKVGIDLHVVDLRIDDERLWLHSLVWPEHIDRASVLAAAIELQRRHPVRLLSGDGLTLLPQALAEVPAGSVPCIFHTAVLNQFSREDRARLADMLSGYGAKQDLTWISAELGGQPSIVHVEIMNWEKGNRRHELLARAHPHGRWLEWVQ